MFLSKDRYRRATTGKSTERQRPTRSPCFVFTVVLCVLMLVAPPRAALAQFPPELRGRVVTRDGSLPVAGARVGVGDGAALARTDADGRFALRGLQPGLQTVHVSALGHAPVRQAVELENGRITTISIVLAPVAIRLDDARISSAPTARAEVATAGATVLDRGAIDASGTTSLAALLDGRAGLVVTSRGGPGAPATLSVRGGAADQLLVLVDGIELNHPITGEADLSTIALGTVERVTIVRGAQAARYGSRALAGVLLVETRRAARDAIRIALDGGTIGERGASIALGMYRQAGTAGVAGTLDAEVRHIEGDFQYDVPFIRGGGSATRANAASGLAAVVSSATYERGGVSLGARAQWLDIGRGMPGTVVQPSVHADQSQRRATGALFLRAARSAWDLAVDASVQRQDARYRDPAPPFSESYDDTVRVDAATASVSAQMLRQWAAFGAGGDVRQTRITASSLATSAPVTVRQAGAWTNARGWREFSLGVPVRAELFGALRVDRTTLLGRTQVMPRAGVGVGSGTFAARASWGRAFSPPGLADQFFQEGVRVRPNPDLRPERVNNEVELSLAVRDQPLGPVRLGADFSAYRADISDMILWFPDFQFVWSPENQNARRRGWDASARVRMPIASLELHGAFSRVGVAYAGPVLTGQLAYRPRTTASAGAAMTVARVRTTLDLRHVGVRRVAAGSAVNALPPFTTVDLRASRTVPFRGWTLDVGAGVDNLFDQRISILPDFPQPGRRLTTSLRLQRGGSPSVAGDASAPPSSP